MPAGVLSAGDDGAATVKDADLVVSDEFGSLTGLREVKKSEPRLRSGGPHAHALQNRRLFARNRKPRAEISASRASRLFQ